MTTQKNKGRSLIGTLFLLGIGFAIGVYRAEIVSFTKNTVQSIRSQ